MFNIDRRAIYLIMIGLLSLPIITGYTLKPARMTSGNKMFDLIENIDNKSPGIAFVFMDFGPTTKAENEPQAEVLLEHLFRRRIPVAVFTLDPMGQIFLETIPKNVATRLSKETGQTWDYGQDWVNIGYKAGKSIFVQSLPKSKNLQDLLGKDFYGTKLSDIPAFKEITKFEQIKLLGEFTGSVGIFDIFVQYFQQKDYVPKIVHGCTSITIPDAYNFLDSGQLNGLLEGLAGAAWYSELLSKQNSQRAPDKAALLNTALGVGHICIIFLIVLGNLIYFFNKRKSRP